MTVTATAAAGSASGAIAAGGALRAGADGGATAAGTVRVEAHLRPRSNGELCDVALESLRRDFPVIVTASLLVNAPLVGALLGLVYGIAVLGKDDVALILPLAAACAVLTLARPLAQGAVAAALQARMEEGREPRLGAAYRTVLARALSTLFAGLAFWTAVLVSGVVWVIPGVIVAGWLALAVPAAACEGKGPFESIGRSTRLLKGHVARSVWLLGLVLLVYVFLAANVFFGIQAILSGAQAFLGLDTSYWRTVLDPSNGLFATAALLAIYLAVEPWKSCLVYHLHLDQRVRFEALDLVRAAEAVGVG